MFKFAHCKKLVQEVLNDFIWKCGRCRVPSGHLIRTCPLNSQCGQRHSYTGLLSRADIFVCSVVRNSLRFSPRLFPTSARRREFKRAYWSWSRPSLDFCLNFVRENLSVSLDFGFKNTPWGMWSCVAFYEGGYYNLLTSTIMWDMFLFVEFFEICNYVLVNKYLRICYKQMECAFNVTTISLVRSSSSFAGEVMVAWRRYKYGFAFVLISFRLLFSFWRALCDGQRINKGIGARRAVAAAAE